MFYFDYKSLIWFSCITKLLIMTRIILFLKTICISFSCIIQSCPILCSLSLFTSSKELVKQMSSRETVMLHAWQTPNMLCQFMLHLSKHQLLRAACGYGCVCECVSDIGITTHKVAMVCVEGWVRSVVCVLFEHEGRRGRMLPKSANGRVFYLRVERIIDNTR